MKYIIVLTLFLPTLMFSQKHDYHWFSGHSLRPHDLLYKLNHYDFNQKELKLIPEQYWRLTMGLTNVTMSDKNGKLLFYSNGCVIRGIHPRDTMYNGSNINDGYIFENKCNRPAWEGTSYDIAQGAMALPHPSKDNIYYFIAQKEDWWYGQDSIYDLSVNALIYAKIDMDKGGGKGHVVEKRKIILENIKLDKGLLTAVKHSNNHDWWMLISERGTNTFHKILLDENGFQKMGTQSIGDAFFPIANGNGQACFSPDGTMYARYSPQVGVQLYDFDRATGELSHPRHIASPYDSPDIHGGISFSPNSQLLYFSHYYKIYQVDLSEPNLEDGVVLVAEWDGTQFAQTFDTNFYLMQIGPDCRIHISTYGWNRYRSIIQFPNIKGIDCDVRQSIETPILTHSPFPSFPNYRLGTGPVCDPTIVSAPSNIESNSMISISLAPNPAHDYFQMNFEQLPSDCILTLYNSFGEQVQSSHIERNEKQKQMKTSSLAAGTYFWKMIDWHGSILGTGKVLIY